LLVGQLHRVARDLGEVLLLLDLRREVLGVVQFLLAPVEVLLRLLERSRYFLTSLSSWSTLRCASS
jgi:hypothetical protein